MPERHPPIATLAAVHARFAPLIEDDGRSRRIRGTALAVAQDWLITIPAGPRRDEALNLLGDAAEMAVEALHSAGACS